MSQKLPITIIIPCFNDAKTLPGAVDSAVASMVNEVVIINDGSTDARTCEVVDGYEAGGLTVLRIPNQGSAKARNHALQRVTTPYVFNLDADDELVPGALSHLYRALAREPDRGVAWGDYYVFGEWDHLQKTADCIDPWQVTILNDLPVSALFRTHTLRQVGGWQGEGYEDWDLWMALAEHGISGCRVDMPVFRYRTQPITAMRGRVRDEMRHEELMAKMHARHPALFAGGNRRLRRSCAPWHVRLALLAAARLPLRGGRRVWLLWRVNQLSRGRVRLGARGGGRTLRGDVGEAPA